MPVGSSKVYTLVFHLAFANKVLRHCHYWLARQYAGMCVFSHEKKRGLGGSGKQIRVLQNKAETISNVENILIADHIFHQICEFASLKYTN